MTNLIDATSLPDPFHPCPGDLYTSPSKHVVVVDIYKGDIVRCHIDGSALYTCFHDGLAFRLYLASCAGLEPCGRVK